MLSLASLAKLLQKLQKHFSNRFIANILRYFDARGEILGRFPFLDDFAALNESKLSSIRNIK
jgi:hypothetical protein